MAEVIIDIGRDIFGLFNVTPVKKELIDSFLKKYKEINKLFNNSMIIIENDKINFFPEIRGMSFTTRDRDDKESIALGVMKFFGSDLENVSEVSLGENSFEEDFYKDLFDLIVACDEDYDDVENPDEIENYIEILLVVNGYPGYYESTAMLTNKGFLWSQNFYDNESEEEDY